MNEPRRLRAEYYNFADQDIQTGYTTIGLPLGQLGTEHTELLDHAKFDISMLPTDVKLRVMYINGHGPVDVERGNITFYGAKRGWFGSPACDIAECRKCIAEYKDELNFPYFDDQEVFV